MYHHSRSPLIPTNLQPLIPTTSSNASRLFELLQSKSALIDHLEIIPRQNILLALHQVIDRPIRRHKSTGQKPRVLRGEPDGRPTDEFGRIESETLERIC